MGVARYLVDKSALARLRVPAVSEELEPLMARGLAGICDVTELEMLYSARNIQERARMKEYLEAALLKIDAPDGIWQQAAEIQEALTEGAQHRSASIPDLLVAATARAQDLEVLHYDRDFDTIARYTEQPVRWVVPAGTADGKTPEGDNTGSRLPTRFLPRQDPALRPRPRKSVRPGQAQAPIGRSENIGSISRS